MGTPLRLLIVEDSPSDADLTTRMLSRAGYDVSQRRVETADEMRSALAEQDWDVVIADYRLPQFDAPGALATLQETGKDIPFLVVSGTVGEDVAVAMMRAGAHDYLMKDSLMRLAPAVQREIREARTRQERRWAAETLRESEARFSTVFRTSPIGIVISRLSDGEIIAANEALLRMRGLGADEVIGRSLNEIHGLGRQATRDRFLDLLEESGRVRDFEAPFVRGDGKIGTALLSAERIELAGQPHLLTLVHDISQRKQAEEALRASEASFRLLAENALDLVYRYRLLPSRGFEYVSPSATQLTGYTPEEHYADPDLGLTMVLPEDRHLLQAALDSAEAASRPISLRWQRKDGAIVWTEQRNRPILDADGRLVAIEGIARDVTERHALLVQIGAQAEQLRQILDHIQDGIVTFDRNRRPFLVNPEAELALRLLTGSDRIREFGSLAGRPLDELLAPRPDGLPHLLTVDGSPPRHFEALPGAIPIVNGGDGWILTLRDVTEQRTLQERSVRQDRLAAVGQLAAGIAHDFNNLMAAIILSAELVRHETGLSRRAVDRLGVVIGQARRATSLTQQILDFGRQTILEPRPLAVVPHLEAFQTLIGRTMPETIRLAIVHGNDDYIVAGDPARLDQVLLNLSLNARDAMPEGGQLTFDVSRLQVSGGRPPFPGMPSGEWVRITVADTGAGIPPDVLPRIFDPFFTTKDPGEGTGLGLAQVYGIVKQHGGFIDVASRPGEGTQFFIYLPSVEAPAANPEVRLVEEVEPGAGETILIVEDDEATRTALRDTLASLNYRTLTASNGADALEVYQANQADIDMVLSDMVMPEMGGRELLRLLRQRDPGLRIGLMTGYPLGRGTRELLLGVTWIQKPIDLAALGRFVRKTLEARPPMNGAS